MAQNEDNKINKMRYKFSSTIDSLGEILDVDCGSHVNLRCNRVYNFNIYHVDDRAFVADLKFTLSRDRPSINDLCPLAIINEHTMRYYQHVGDSIDIKHVKGDKLVNFVFTYKSKSYIFPIYMTICDD